MSIDAKLVAELRAQTGAGMMDAKKALEETGGNIEQAIDILRKSGVAKAAKKSSRETNEGLVYAYIHSNGKIGVLLTILSETDFVAKNELFVSLCHDVAMHVCAMDPLYLKREDVPAELVEKEREIYIEEMKAQMKPEEIATKIVEGKLNKWYSEVVLLDQPYIKDDSKTIQDLLTEKIASLGENIQIKEFCRFKI